MSEQENVQMLKDAYTAFKGGDISSLLNMYAEDEDWIYPSVEELPYSGRRRGREQIGQLFLRSLPRRRTFLSLSSESSSPKTTRLFRRMSFPEH